MLVLKVLTLQIMARLRLVLGLTYRFTMMGLIVMSKMLAQGICIYKVLITYKLKVPLAQI